jgi:hypothetical protein
MEIMEQTIRIRGIVNRVEGHLAREGDTIESAKDNRLFRKSQRRMALVPLVIRGTDLLGEFSEVPCYALNTSETGVCLLLPDGLVSVGQTIRLYSNEFNLSGMVRWAVEGRTGNMMFAGVEFLPAKSEDANSHASGSLVPSTPVVPGDPINAGKSRQG